MDAVLSVMVLAALALLAGAIYLWRRGSRRQAALMFALVGVIAANIAILTIPAGNGTAPVATMPK